MSKSSTAPVATHDFAKNNGTSSKDHMTMPGGPSMTRQEFADECDVNNIMQRYDQHLADPTRSIREPRYYDFTAMPATLMDAMHVMNNAHEAFMLLPATVRREFDNDPAMWADFAADPENLPQMRTWGLAPPEKPKEKPVEVRVVPDPTLAPGARAPAAEAPKKAP